MDYPYQLYVDALDRAIERSNTEIETLTKDYDPENDGPFAYLRIVSEEHAALVNLRDVLVKPLALSLPWIDRG